MKRKDNYKDPAMQESLAMHVIILLAAAAMAWLALFL